jgi:hypothetical protein
MAVVLDGDGDHPRHIGKSGAGAASVVVGRAAKSASTTQKPMVAAREESNVFSIKISQYWQRSPSPV